MADPVASGKKPIKAKGQYAKRHENFGIYAQPGSPGGPGIPAGLPRQLGLLKGVSPDLYEDCRKAGRDLLGTLKYLAQHPEVNARLLSILLKELAGSDAQFMGAARLAFIDWLPQLRRALGDGPITAVDSGCEMPPRDELLAMVIINARRMEASAPKEVLAKVIDVEAAQAKNTSKVNGKRGGSNGRRNGNGKAT